MLTSPPIIFDLGGDVSTNALIRAFLFFDINEVNSQSLLNALLNVYTAFTNFFKGRAKFPRFKSKKTPQRSYQCPQHCTVNFEQGIINLPKIKSIKTIFSREFVGNIKTVTISKTATGKYYASVLVENTDILPTPTTIEPKPVNDWQYSKKSLLANKNKVKTIKNKN